MLTANALAKRVNCHWCTVKRAIAKGKLNAKRVGHFWFVQEDDFYFRWLKRMQRLSRFREIQRERLRVEWASKKRTKARQTGFWVRSLVCKRDRVVLSRTSDGTFRCNMCGFEIVLR